MDLFKKWDADGSGTVDKPEFRRALHELRISGSDDEFDVLFECWDTDGACEFEIPLSPCGGASLFTAALSRVCFLAARGMPLLRAPRLS